MSSRIESNLRERKLLENSRIYVSKSSATKKFASTPEGMFAFPFYPQHRPCVRFQFSYDLKHRYVRQTYFQFKFLNVIKELKDFSRNRWINKIFSSHCVRVFIYLSGEGKEMENSIN